jgi:hypothetical protein
LRGLTMLAWIIGGLPIVTFVAIFAMTDGAPIRAPSVGSGMPAGADVATDWPGQAALSPPAGIPNLAVTHAQTRMVPEISGWAPPPADEFRHDRTHAGWDRLERLANAGDRDALVFLTLMRSGAIPGQGWIHKAAAH